MSAACRCLAVLVVPLVAGCGFVPRTALDASQSRCRVLAEQHRAVQTELDGVRDHARRTEDDLQAADQRLAAAQEQLALAQQQLTNYQRERGQLHAEVKQLVGDRGPLAPAARRQMEDLAAAAPSLHYDPQSGVARVDTDILFDSGKAQLKDGAQRVLDELTGLLKSPRAAGLKVLVVGHTDARGLRRGAREQFSDNFDLSTERAQAVAGYLRRGGVAEERIGVAGFGGHQPVATDLSRADQQKNRRVEIFIMPADAPIVGWTDSSPTLYR